VRLVSPIGSAAGGNGNLSTSLSNVAKLAAYLKFVWVFNANYDGTIIYNDPVDLFTYKLFISGNSNTGNQFKYFNFYFINDFLIVTQHYSNRTT
jgi:hypothetical protein